MPGVDGKPECMLAVVASEALTALAKGRRPLSERGRLRHLAEMRQPVEEDEGLNPE